MTRIFSGIQPTGRKHLGNYLGAIRHYVDAQSADSIYCIVDLHSTTVQYQPEDLRRYLYDSTALLIAAGLDPSTCTLFRQSDVREHSELCWLLCGVTAHGELNRMTQFKDKSAKQQDLISASLFMYPVLMAADILLYDTQIVPVGDDQRQHVELTRVIAERFNQRFGETFVVPAHRIQAVGARIMDLANPETKMSTTAPALNGVVLVLDDEATTTKKFKSAVTDSGSEIVRSDDKPGISNLIDILAAVQGKTPEAIEAEWAGKRYGELKVACADAVNAYLEPVRKKYPALREDEAALEATLARGAEKARAIAAKTMQRVRDRMGIGPSKR